MLRAVTPAHLGGFSRCVAVSCECRTPKIYFLSNLLYDFHSKHLCQLLGPANPPNGDNMKTFEISFRYQDRKNESQTSSGKVEATSLPGAVARATREFVKSLDRKQRFDMNKNGLEIKAVHVEGAGEASKSAAAGESAAAEE
jgi:hypothetical protein